MIMIIRLFTLLFILFVASGVNAETFTFHTAGSYQNVTSWGMYPGNFLNNGDTILIEANCDNIDLYIADGHILFNENVDNISITYVRLESCNSTMSFLTQSFLDIVIFGSLDVKVNSQISFENYPFVIITNLGNGIHFSGTDADYSAYIEYYNYGIQNSFILDLSDLYFTNDGIIKVEFGDVYLNCDLELANGTIEGPVPFNFHVQTGSMNQNCNNCTATFENLNELRIDHFTTYIYGEVRINPTD